MKNKKIKCFWCKKEFEKKISRIKQTEKLKQKHTCSPRCSSAIANAARESVPTTKNAEHTRRDKEKFPERDKARQIVRKAVKSGKLIPLKECEFCGSDNNIQAHHPDHFSPLLLVYLCKKCHAEADCSADKWIDLATDYSKCIN